MALRARVQCRPEFAPRGGKYLLPRSCPFPNAADPKPAQNADRFAANRFEAGVVKVTSEFKSSDLSVGLHAVDYYVYRLRRLII